MVDGGLIRAQGISRPAENLSFLNACDVFHHPAVHFGLGGVIGVGKLVHNAQIHGQVKHQRHRSGKQDGKGHAPVHEEKKSHHGNGQQHAGRGLGDGVGPLSRHYELFETCIMFSHLPANPFYSFCFVRVSITRESRSAFMNGAWEVLKRSTGPYSAALPSSITSTVLTSCTFLQAPAGGILCAPPSRL